MHLLIGYGYYPTTTGNYFEAAAGRQHRITYVGTPWGTRPGFLPDVDLHSLAADLPEPPDLFLYVDSGHAGYLPRGIEKLGCPTAIYLIDVHLGPRLRRPLAALFDYVFIAQRDYLADYQTAPAHQVHWLPLAGPAPSDPVLDGEADQQRYDVAFVGNLGPQATDPRARLLAAIEQRFTMNDFRRNYLPAEMTALYRQARIVINRSIRDDLNMRVFEAMATGALLVTNRIGNGLLDLFQDRVHLIVYDTDEQALDAIAYYLDHPDERQRVATAGQAAVLAAHTYDHRLAQILRTVFETYPGARAPLRSAPAGRRLRHYAELYSKFRLLDASFDTFGSAVTQRQARASTAAQFLAGIVRRLRNL